MFEQGEGVEKREVFEQGGGREEGSEVFEQGAGGGREEGGEVRCLSRGGGGEVEKREVR